MVAFKAHFDGKVIVRDEPLELPRGQALIVHVEADRADLQSQPVNAIELLRSLAGSVEAPADWSEQHDHYLYGTPKRPSPDNGK